MKLTLTWNGKKLKDVLLTEREWKSFEEKKIDFWYNELNGKIWIADKHNCQKAVKVL